MARHQESCSRMADLERNTRDLQESVMSIRMTPIAMVFNCFPRMLRDLAGKLGKKIELKMVGEGTRARQRGLIEKITDPMTPWRNSLGPRHRRCPRRGSPRQTRNQEPSPCRPSPRRQHRHRGRTTGAGLKRERILAKARERDIPVPANPSDAEVWNLIFEPAFRPPRWSPTCRTRRGMDVVRRNISALGGSVEIESAAGVGTR